MTSSPLVLSGRDVTAVLGPTNTGKTHLAIERMVAHETGVIGLPLRLLAREVYGRVAQKVGTANVALITGEEKIAPPGARYSVCTVEAMPRETDAAFVAIDEVQLAADMERGHIFTDRILHLRGRHETLLLGAGTMRGILEKLLKGLSVVTRPRMSHLAHAGQKKITRLPRRSAIVAFSADEVYAIAELIRRQRGGAAVVLGALSPRTRNSQVELYQSGDVDFLVATDAIGMGLNLDVDHVAFAQDRKFDGHQYRQLTAAELGQIAGRAGRHVRDGTFGETGQVDTFSDEIVERIESHTFEPVKVLQWRTADFDFSTLQALRASIEAIPPVEGLTRALPATDAQALERLSQDDAIRRAASGRRNVELLWDVCALPDYRRIAPAQHSDLIAALYLDLAGKGRVDENYLAEQVRRADSVEGDIDTLSQRIAEIRTWTYVSHRPGWLADPAHWQEKTRDIEDRLSDALHERLTKRFVDRRTSVLMRRLRENEMLEAEISPTGEVLVEGHHVGELQGFRFTADQTAEGEEAKAVRAAAQKALATEFENRAQRFALVANGDLALSSEGLVRWLGSPVGALSSSEDPLRPRVILLADEQLTGPARDKVAARIERFVAYQIDTALKPLIDLKSAEQLSGIARGVAFQLVENFGLLNRRDVAEDIRSLDQEARGALRRLGVRFGAFNIFVPALIKPAPAGLLTMLWALQNDAKDKPGFGEVVATLAAGRTSIALDESFEKDFYRLAGFRIAGKRAVRVDILERLADLIRPALAWRPGQGSRPEGAYDGNAFIVTPAMMSILGATPQDMEEILKALGYRGQEAQAAEVETKLSGFDQAAREAKAASEAAGAAASQAAAEAAVPAGGGASVIDAAPEDVAEAAGSNESVEAAETSIEPASTTDQLEPQADVVAQAEPAPEPDRETTAEASAPAEVPLLATPAPEAAAAESVPATTDTAPAADVGAEPAEAEAPKTIMLWRPGRFDGGRGRQGQRGAPRRQVKPGEAGEGGREAGEQGPRRFKGKQDRPDRGGRDKGKGKGPERPKPRQFDDARPPREPREKKADPDSPFAKLAALKEQMKK